MPRARPYHITVREKRELGHINRNSLNSNVEFFEWLLDSAEKGRRPLYLSKKWLAEAYGMLDAVRHVGPRRRAEMQARASPSSEDRQAFRESWEVILGRPLESEEEFDEECAIEKWNRRVSE